MKKTLVISCFFLLGLTALAQAGYYDDPTHVTNNLLACEECHGGPDWNQPGAAHPNLLRNDSTAPAGAEEVCSDCHNDDGSRSATYPSAAKVLTHKRNCWDCHQNHQDAVTGYTNVNYVTETMGVCADDASVPCTTDADCATTCGSPVLFNDPLVHTQVDGSGICQVCHTATNYWRADGSLQGHNAGLVCTDCHIHGEAFSAGCNTCHGEPPTSTNKGLAEPPDATGSQTVGMHEIHAVPSPSESGNGYGYDCGICHQGGMLVNVVIDGSNNLGMKIPYANSVDTFGNLQWQFYDIFNTTTTYIGQNTVTYIGDHDGSNGTLVNNTGQIGDGSLTCSAVYCHSTGRSLIFGTDPVGESFAWDGSTLDPDGITCNNCHMEVPLNDLHEAHVLVRKFDCNYCHFDTATAADYPNAIPFIKDKSKHANGTFDIVPSPTYDTSAQTGLSNPFTYEPAPGGGTCFFPTDGTSCHSRFNKPLVAVWTTNAGDNGFCGNGIVDGLEACDDGNNNDFDACSNGCESQSVPGPGPCTDADGDEFIDIADSANGCYIAGTPATAPPYDECDNDPSKLAAVTYYRDQDGDGYGDPNNSQTTCIDPGAGWVTVDGDPDDTDPTIPGAGTTAYFPAIKDGPQSDGLWLNFLSICAVDPSVPVTLNVTLYNSDGSLNFNDPNLTTPINGCLVQTPNWIKHAALDTETFNGTVVVQAGAPIVGMTNSLAPPSNNPQAFNIYEAPIPKLNLFFPAGFDNTAAGYRNIVHIQNTEPTPVTVTVDYIDDALPSVADVYVIPGNGEYEKVIRNVFGGDFNGSISVTATGNVAGMLRYEKMAGTTVESMSIYESTVERNAIYYPYLYDGHTGYNNYISTMNPSGANIDCTYEYYLDDGTPYYTDGPVTIAPGARSTITPCFVMDGSVTCDGLSEIDGTSWSSEYEGGMTATCTGNVVSTTNVIKFANVEGLNFHESARPMQRMIFPQVYEVAPYSNTLHLLNPTAAPITVNITLNYTDGTVLGTSSPTIPPFGKHIMQPTSINTNPASLPTNGSLTVDAGANTVTGVLVYETSLMITVYEGVEQ